VQSGGDRGGHDGLSPDADDSAELANDDGLEADPFRSGARGRHDQELNAAWLAAARPAEALPSTSRMNSSSSRLTLLRMLVTAIPCADSCANMSLRLCVFDISISSVWSSDRTAVNPDN